MKTSTTPAGKAIAFVAFVGLTLCVATAAGGNVRGAATNQLNGRRLGRVPIRREPEGFRGFESKGQCFQWGASPSYDHVKLKWWITDGLEACKRVCNAVQCPAFSYAPKGQYRPGGWSFMPLRFRWSDECIIYHDYGSQLPGTYSHHKGTTNAFDFQPDAGIWLLTNWDWANGECFISTWRDNLRDKRRLGFWSRVGKGVKAAWRVVTGKTLTNLRNGAEQNLVALQNELNDRTAPRNQCGQITGGTALDNMVCVSEEWLQRRYEDSALTFYDYAKGAWKKTVGQLVTQVEVDAYCWYKEWWNGQQGNVVYLNIADAAAHCLAPSGSTNEQYRVGRPFHSGRHVRPDGLSDMVMTTNPLHTRGGGIGINNAGNGHH